MIGDKINFKDIKSLIFIWVSSLTNIALAFINQTILARNLSIEDYGLFNSYIGFINILIPIIGVGITTYWLKRFGKSKELSKDLILASLSILLISFVLTISIVFITTDFHGFNNFLILGILSFVILGTLFSDIIATIFQVKNKFLSFSIVQSCSTILRFVFLLILIFIIEQSSLVNISIIWALSGILIPFIFYKTVIKEIPNPFLNISKVFSQFKSRYTLRILKGSSIFGIVGLLYLGWSQGHIVFAKIIFGNYGAGLYSSVIILSIAISIFPNVIFSKFLAPKYHKLIYSNPISIKSSFWPNNILLFISGVITTIIIYFFSEFIIDIAFGDKYEEAISILKILCLTFPMRFCGFNAGLILTTRDFLYTKLKILLVIVIINLLLAYFLSQVYEIHGLALSIVVSELILVLIYIKISKSLLNKICIQTKNMH